MYIIKPSSKHPGNENQMWLWKKEKKQLDFLIMSLYNLAVNLMSIFLANSYEFVQMTYCTPDPAPNPSRWFRQIVW